MQVALITPVPLLDTIGTMTNFHMVLPEKLDDEKYREFYESCPGYKILDNGAAEEGTRGANFLLASATILGVDEIVCPDVLRDKNETIEGTAEFLDFIFDEAFPGKLAGVVQGSTKEDVVDCMHWMCHQLAIDVICFPRVLCHQFGPGTRLELIREFGTDIVDKYKKQIHFLGSSKQPSEIRALGVNQRSLVRSIDTCAPIAMAMVGARLANHPGTQPPDYTGRPAGYFGWDPNIRYTGPEGNPEAWLTIKNCQTFLEWADAI